MSDALLQLEDITKVYGKNDARTTALSHIRLQIGESEFIGIVGASGSGKTTLLNILGCMEQPTGGYYTIRGERVNDLSSRALARIRNKTFGFVMQDYALIEHYTVYRNVQLPLQYAKQPRNTHSAYIHEALRQLGIDDKADRPVNTLSGGQKQRTAIARAIINDAKIILADEPTGALDTKNGQQVMEIFSELHRQGRTVIMVTHNRELLSFCTRIITLEDGEISNDAATSAGA